MALEHSEDLVSVRIINDPVASSSNRFWKVENTVKESENLGDNLPILDDLDSYLQDIDDRLMISRMVSNSVIKGMVSAVEQHATDNIAEKEAEISRLKAKLHSPVCLYEKIDFLKKKKEELSSLRQELDGLNKLIVTPDPNHITINGSMEVTQECDNGSYGEMIDHLQCKKPGSHGFSFLPCEAHGKHDEVIITMPEDIESGKLCHMSKESLVEHFKGEMIRMKRNHEANLQEMTEKYYCLRREYLKNQGSSLPLKKHKDLDFLKRKISEVTLKLDDILVETKMLPSFKIDLESVFNLKERIDALFSENHRFRDMLADKKRQIECLSAEVSDAGDKISAYSLAEANLLGEIKDLKEQKEKVRIKAMICEEVYQCFLRRLLTDMPCIGDKSMEFDADIGTCENSRGEAGSDVRSNIEYEIEHLCVESMFSGFIYAQSLMEAEEQLGYLSDEYIREKALRVSLEQKVLNQVELAKLEFIKNQESKQEMLQLTASLQEKQKKLEETGYRMARERELFEQANQELESLRDVTKRQGVFIAEINKESEGIRSDLNQALEIIEKYKEESCLLRQKLSLAMDKLNKKEEEKKLFLFDIKEKHNKILSAEVNDREYMKQMESVMEVSLWTVKSLADLESRATMDIKRNQSRLDVLGGVVKSLTQDAELLKRRGLSYKQSLEKKCLDLEKAEKEVDLLGDEVDNLVGLLEKIYITLDHYSPVLKHYPGVMEILRLVKIALSGDSLNSNSK